MSMHATDSTEALDRVRAEMDDVDRAVVQLIIRRCALAQAAGRAKSHAGLPPADLAREAAVLRDAAAAARSARIDEEAVRHIFWCLIDLGRRAQTVS